MSLLDSVLNWLVVLFLWLFPSGKRVKPPKKLRVGFTQGADMQFSANLTWTPSTTPTVTNQELTVTVNGMAQPTVALGPTVASYTFLVDPGATVAASLLATDGVTDSAPATVSGTAPPAPPPPTPPEPPTGFTLNFTPAP